MFSSTFLAHFYWFLCSMGFDQKNKGPWNDTEYEIHYLLCSHYFGAG